MCVCLCGENLKIILILNPYLFGELSLGKELLNGWNFPDV